MTNKTPVILPLTKQPRPVQWAIAFHAWLLTWLPESYPDRDVIAVTFEEQCIEAYQMGLGWWISIVVWAWGDVGITVGINRLREPRQKLKKQNTTKNDVKRLINIMILMVIILIFVTIISMIISSSNLFILPLIMLIISLYIFIMDRLRTKT